MIEVKNCNRLELAKWIDEMLAEVSNADADAGFVFHKRKGKGSPMEWYVTCDGLSFVILLRKALGCV